MRDALAGAEAELAEHRARITMEAANRDAHERHAHLANVEALEQRLADAERQVAAVYGSASWRIGNMIVRVLTLGRGRGGAT